MMQNERVWGRGWWVRGGAISSLLLAASVWVGCTPIPPFDRTTPTDGSGDGGTTDAFAAADAKRGGSLYDKWWGAAGLAPPTEDHPLWAGRPDTESNTRTGADTWRCKECHGWDYKGVDGAYGSGSHRTGIAGIFSTTMSGQEVFDLLSDPADHAFGETGLTDGDLWDLAKFVIEGQIDTSEIIGSDGVFTGSVTNGQPLFDTACSVCHGTDGLAIPPGGDDDFDEYIGLLSNENAWEFQHKVRFGQPGSVMPPHFDLLTTEEVGELGAYSQSLPEAP